jgi:N-acetylmuramoyl-L-alanine amidase
VRWGGRARPASACLAVLLGVLGLAPSPAGVLEVVKGGSSRSVPLEEGRGYPAAGAAALARALGYAWTDNTIDMGGERVRFSVGSPFFSVGQEVFQLPNPVYREGPRVMIPVSWALDWLPHARSRNWRALDGRLVERPTTTVRPPRRDSWLVVIDPGHGGKDPGTIGVGGTKEKDVTLAIGRKLAERLGREADIEVVLTRDRDTLIALADRPRVTQLRGMQTTPDLFVSIHGNSMPRKPSSHRGVETYFLAAAKTEQARQVALRENSAIEFEPDARPEDLEPLQFILSDLQSTGNLRESSLLAAAVAGAVDEQLQSPNLGVKQAGFLVLVGATMPAVLVEVGYLSNRDEEKLLRSSSYQAKIADALAEAVVEYLEGYGRRVWSSYGSGR